MHTVHQRCNDDDDDDEDSYENDDNNVSPHLTLVTLDAFPFAGCKLALFPSFSFFLSGMSIPVRAE